MTNPTQYLDLNRLADMHPSFTPDDPVMNRYEMIREYRATAARVVDICAKFGVSERQFHKVRRKFEEGGILALVNQKPGPKGPHKITVEVEEIILEIRRTEKLSIEALAEAMLERHQIKVSSSAIDEVLSQHRITKKKRGRKPKKQNHPKE